MRACEGCRRRKIKCDAATTNAWPCGACIRLKLNCVPPTISYDKDYNGTQTFDLKPTPLDSPSQQDYQSMAHELHQIPPFITTSTSGMYQSSPYVDRQSQKPYHHRAILQPQVVQQAYSQTSAPPARGDSVSSFLEALRELNIDHTAIGKHY
jgi:hypothetical protein